MNNRINKETVDKTNEFIDKIIDVPVENISFDSNIPLDDDITDSNKVYKGNVSVLFADMRNSTIITRVKEKANGFIKKRIRTR